MSEFEKSQEKTTGTQSKEMVEVRQKWLFRKRMTIIARKGGHFNSLDEVFMRMHRSQYLRLRNAWNIPATALAAANAQNARYRAALKEINDKASRGLYENERSALGDIVNISSAALYAALAETEEA